MSLVSKFITELVKFLTKSSCEDNESACKLVKFYESGGLFDFSFPLSLKIWKNYLKELNDDDVNKHHDNILSYSRSDSTEEPCDLLCQKSLTWIFAVDSIEIKDHRCSFTIKRTPAYSTFLKEIAHNRSYGRTFKDEECETMSIEIDDQGNPSITQHRVELVASIIKNLLDYSKFTLVDEPSVAKHKILVTSKSSLSKNHDQQLDRKLLTCGVVVNSKDKKVSTETGAGYIKQRCEDMHLMSIHKYGIRVKEDEAFKSLIAKLGRFAATLDLLEVKQSSAVTLTPDNKQAFILYNSARMETLMEKFEKKVGEGYYEELPGIDEVDLSLLKEDEEWQLTKLLLSFPDVIDRSINELDLGKVSLHLLYKYITHLVNIFSIYYRRVRLLTENRKQLMPTLHTKIHFLRALQKVMNETLAILEIAPIAFM